MAPGEQARSADPVRALVALQAARSAAYAAGSVDDLRPVYPRGSALFTADATALRSLVPDGGTVRGLRFELRSPAVRERGPARAVLEVTVRRGEATVLSAAGTARPLPARDIGRVRVVLVRAGPAAAWTVAGSEPVPGSAAAPGSEPVPGSGV